MRLDQPDGKEFWIDLELREALGSTASDWNQDRREKYLLRQDIAQPLSIDKRVWAAASGQVGCRAAFSVVVGDNEARVQSIWFSREVEGEARLLGYDIADEVYLSGLSNCGYTEDEKAVLCPIWVPRLNAFNLFDAADDAHEFRAVTDARVPEHAPFFVFGIYQLV